MKIGTLISRDGHIGIIVSYEHCIKQCKLCMPHGWHVCIPEKNILYNNGGVPIYYFSEKIRKRYCPYSVIKLFLKIL